MAPKGRAGAAATPTWNWIASKRGPEIGGAIAAMFKSEGSAPPAALRGLYPNQGEVALRASMFAREAIANSWDAYRLADRDHREFTIDCTFGTLHGADAHRFRKATDILGLSTRVGGGPERAPRSVVGLDPDGDDCLSGDAGSDVGYLRFEEHFGGGMGGPALDRALMKVGWAQGRAGAGGSYGYGKAAVAQGSRINSIIVYTCFPPDPKDPTVTRRLFGVTYWQPHSSGDTDYTGWATYGRPSSDGIGDPLENEDADAIAAALGVPVRDPGEPRDLGSTILILDPAFGPEDLRAAVLANWWPALLETDDRQLSVRIAEEGGAPVQVSPDGVALLNPFVETYCRDFEHVPDHHFGEPLEDETHGLLGELDLIGYKPAPEEGTASLVALVRSHHMVIKYRDWSGTPVIRGSFLADESINENLRQTEPPEHDRWMQTRSGDHRGEKVDYQIARAVARGVNDAVDQFRREIDPVRIRNAGVAEVFGNFLSVAGATTGRQNTKAGADGKKAPKRKPIAATRRKIHVHLVHPVEDTDIDRPTRASGPEPRTLVARANVRFGLMDWVPEDTLDVEVVIRARIAEDSGSHGDPLGMIVNPPSGFTRTSADDADVHRFKGVLRHGREVEFKTETAPYDEEWTVEVFFDADPIAVEVAE